jgi:dTDP-4-amino-4,6-dideoxygalactose transaminase
MPNLNAALLVAQMEQVSAFVTNKRKLASEYVSFFENKGMTFVQEPEKCKSNYWLNALILEGEQQRDEFLAYTNKHGVMTRPIWKLMTELEMFQGAQSGSLENVKWLVDRVVNIPSSVRV